MVQTRSRAAHGRQQSSAVHDTRIASRLKTAPSARQSKSAHTRGSAKRATAARAGGTLTIAATANEGDIDPVTDIDRRTSDIGATVYALISRAKPTSTICPSEVARALHARDAHTYPDWRGMMDEVRGVVWGLVEQGKVEVCQKGELRTLDQRDSIRGPIRVRRGAEFGAWDGT